LVSAILLVGLIACGGDDSPIQPGPVCTISLAPGSASFAAEGGTGGVTVTIPANCTWAATSNAAWITITSGSNGSGGGSIAYTVAANTSTDSRSGAIRVGDLTHAVTQQGRTPTVCSYELSPGSADVGKDGSSGTFTVSAPNDCAWTAASHASWLVVTGGGQGSGVGLAQNAGAI
jgi:hypothetical protein